MSSSPLPPRPPLRFVLLWGGWTGLLVFAGLSCASHLPGVHPVWAVGWLLAQGLAHAGLLATLLLLVGATLGLWLPGRGAAAGQAVAAALLLAFVLVDAQLYGLVGLHINASTFGHLLEPGALATLGIERGDLIELAGVALMAVVAGLLFPADHRDLHRLLRSLAALVAANGVFTAGAALWRFEGVEPLIGLSDAMPLAPSVRADPLLSRLTGRQPKAIDDDYQFPVAAFTGLPHWPLRALPQPTHAARRLDVLVVAIESLRADALGTMPNLQAFLHEAQVAPLHYASGNCSFLGSFSLLSGLDPTYWMARESWRNPRGLGAFVSLGYQLEAPASVMFNFGVLTKAAPDNSVRVTTELTDDILGRDERSTAAILEWIARPRSAPSLAVLTFGASHWPYLSSRSRAGPVGLGSSWEHRAEVARYRARYQDALATIDAHLGRVLHAIDAAGLRDRMVVVVTGDHGEAFLEHGVFGHGSRMDDEQLRVPLGIRLPGVPAGALGAGPSHHADVLPTVLGALGADLAPPEPGTGIDLRSAERRAGPFILGGCGIDTPTGYALLQGDDKVLFQRTGQGAKLVTVLGPQGALPPPAWVPEALAAAERSARALLAQPVR